MCLGHVQRGGEYKINKRIGIGKPGGARPIERPRMRWRYHVLRHFWRLGSEMGINEDRNQWRHVIGDTKIHLGNV